MADIPTVGGDKNTWGTKLNTFLAVAHETSGGNGGKTKSSSVLYTPSPGTVVSTVQERLRKIAYISDFTDNSLNAAITAIGVTPTTLYIDVPATFTGTATIPSNIHVVVLVTGSIVGNGSSVLTIVGTFNSGSFQCFSGFSPGGIKFDAYGTNYVVNPVVFGMKFTNADADASGNITAWNIMINSLLSANGYPTIVLPPNALCKIDDIIVIDRPCTIFWNKARFIVKSTSYGLSKTAIKITSPGVTIHDGPIVSTGMLSTYQSTNGTGILIQNAGGCRLYNPNVSEFTSGIRILGSTISLQDTILYSPEIANCTTLFSTDVGAGGSVNNVNVYGGYLLNDNLVAYGITNARCVDLNGAGGAATSDGVNFYGTIIQSANINGGRKLNIAGMSNCSFNNVYWDGSSISAGGGKDIRIEAGCTGIVLNGGSDLGVQRIEVADGNGVSIYDTRKGTYLSGGIPLDASSSNAAGIVGKWIFSKDNWANLSSVGMPPKSGFLIVSANAELGIFSILSDGTVTLITGSANMAATDTASKFCVYNNATIPTIKNSLGVTANVRAEFTNF